MSSPGFDLKELNVVGETFNAFGGPNIAVFDSPFTGREAAEALFRREPYCQVLLGVAGAVLFAPGVNPDNIARAFTFDGSFIPGVSNQSGGTDMFGIEWEYVPVAGGSMVRPGVPLLEDANDWPEKVVWPDIESWDWAGAKALNEGYLSTTDSNYCWFLNGYFERLISFMEFEGAIIALVDDEQKDAVKAFFEKLTDLYIGIFDKYLEYFPQIDIFYFHDDWGSQKNTFFSPEVAEEMIVPYMKRLTDHVHGCGMSCELHSCGQNILQVPNMIAAGWDAWTPQAMNDTDKIYELYGDRILIGVMPELFDTKTTSEEEQRARARAYADQYCNPDKPSFLNMYASGEVGILTPTFWEELYKQSRLNYTP
jgi:hypothetical protein